MPTAKPRLPAALMEESRSVALLSGCRIQIAIPSILAVGEPFTAQLSVTNRDGLPPAGFDHTLRIENSVGIDGLPPEFRFDPAEPIGEITGLTATGPDTALLRATVATAPNRGVSTAIASNPAWVFRTPPYRLFWGDLHVHTHFSNCSGWRCLDPEWCYRYARDIAFLDFAAPADHLRGIAADPARWPRLQALARAFNSPGRFAAFLAFESSHAQGCGGDNNAYFLHDDNAHFWLDRADMRGISPAVPLEDLWRQLDATGRPYFTVPHHTGRAGKYRHWEEPRYDATREPLFEIYSSWGSSEMRWSHMPISGGNNDAPSYFTDALRAGARFGVIASSDDHATLPGAIHHFRVNPFGALSLNGYAHKGLAAVRAPDLSRESLFEAMRRRQTFATTHARTLADLRVGEAGMGQEVEADAGLRKRREIRVRLTLDGGAHAAQVQLMRNGQPFAAQSLRGATLAESVNEVVFEDADALDTIALRDTRFHPAPFAVYYARIEDANGATQWTSPVWLDLA